MPAVSKLSQLTPELLAELDKKIIENGFSRYRDLSAWLAIRGYTISKDTVNRRGQELERKLEAVKRATEQARAIVAASPDDEGAMNDALIRLVQQIDFDILVQLDQAGVDEVDPKSLAAITRSVAQLARASVKQKEWQTEYRERLKEKVAAASTQIAEVTKAAGLSDEAEAKIRRALFTINV